MYSFVDVDSSLSLISIKKVFIQTINIVKADLPVYI